MMRAKPLLIIILSLAGALLAGWAIGGGSWL